MATFLDVHILQTVPPSNLNRDDAGTPKQAIYGGVRRARVSSQAWKRATRKLLAEKMPAEERGTRTRKILPMLTRRVVERSELDEEQAERLARMLLEAHKISLGKNDNNTGYLLFFGVPQLDAVAGELVARADELLDLDDNDLKKTLEGLDLNEALMTGHPLDVALFGRMVADIPSINVDAATQVAHALSTHPVEIEFDYFTAVDDEQELTDKEGAGAAMIGTVEFNSATLYRYATLGLDQLVENMGGAGDDVADAAARFVDAFTRSIPTGYKNSFAHGTLPSFVAVVFRDDQPVNLVSAFEQPVRSTRGHLAKSIVRLADEQLALTARWGEPAGPTVASYDLRTSDDDTGADADSVARVEAAFGPSRPHAEALDAVRSAVADRLAASVS